MATNILGLYSGHDAHCCLLRDGALTHHYSTDRYTRRKHSIGFRQDVLEKMLADAKIGWADIDSVAVGGCCWRLDHDASGLFNALHSMSEGFERLANSPTDTAIFDNVGGRFTQAEASHLGHTVKTYQIDHHLAHCAQAHYTGPFAHSLAFSFDGGGDEAFMLSCRGVSNQLGFLEYNDGRVHPNRPSIGNIWTLVTRRLYQFAGGNVDGEGKLMGHAAYGTPHPKYVAILERLINYGYANPQIVDEEFAKLRRAVKPDDFNSTALKNLSASIQQATENVYTGAINRRAAREQTDKICLSGGVAYNCCANRPVAQDHPDVFVANCPNDGGLAVGACLFVWHHVLGNAFTGVDEFDPFKGAGGAGVRDVAVADQVVDDLLAGKLVAWFDGRAENGARALGHRSILADPRLPDVRERINTRVKSREWYRPFAPSVLEGRNEWALDPVPASWYMSFSARVAPRWAARVPGVVHVDGTCRPQVVTKRNNEMYWEIIDRFRQATGVPMVLNTSFNIQEPIVETEEQACATFNRSGLDVLYVNGTRHAR